MRISVKGRYALASVIEIARNLGSGENVSVVNVAAALGISKLYLEQVFSQLKKAGILNAAKGSRGGYQLSRVPAAISVWEVLSALESALYEPVESTVAENAPEIEIAVKRLVFEPLDITVREFLSGITVQNLLDSAEKQKAEQAFMLNI